MRSSGPQLEVPRRAQRITPRRRRQTTRCPRRRRGARAGEARAPEVRAAAAAAGKGAWTPMAPTARRAARRAVGKMAQAAVQIQGFWRGSRRS
jgi:hypothetical protein